MCGIVGFTGEKDLHSLVLKMNKVQKHRGPDDIGSIFCGQNKIHLAMSRLSILDLNNGHQPMSIMSEKYWIVFNGEIFNAPILRIELESLGYRFKTTNSDTEVLLYLYAHFKSEMVKKLNGMFSFVIYDKNESKLFCARDPFGIKPFYYSVQNYGFNFASEIKSLLMLPWISKDLNWKAVYHFFSFQSIPAPLSIYNNIHKLKPGHFLLWDLKTKCLSTNQYWKPNFGNESPIPENDLPHYIEHELIEAIKRWSLSDVQIACSLSSGLDSSTIVALLAKSESKKIKTFTLGFDDQIYPDERKYAKLVADKYETDHKEIIINSKSFIQDWDDMLYSLDEPYAGGMPSWFVFKDMAKEVKVGMTGTGGDELFSNYGKWLGYEKKLKLIRYMKNMSLKGISFYDSFWHYNIDQLYSPNYFDDLTKQRLIFKRSFLKDNILSTNILKNLTLSNVPKDKIASIDFQLQLPEEFLLMTDRFSMAHSIEARTPFLDLEFVNKMLMIPSKIRIGNKPNKSLLKKSIKHLLPDQLLKEKKSGFTLPLEFWLKENFRSQIMELTSPSFLKDQGIFQIDIFERFILPFFSGKKHNIQQVWTIFSFQTWYNKFMT